MHAGPDVHRLEPCEDRVQLAGLGEGEVEVLGEAVVAEVAALERSTALEDQRPAKGRTRQAHEEPGEAVVALEDGLDNAAAAGAGEPIRKEGQVSLWNHGSCPHEGAKLAGLDVDA
jgi:hypothetical protein